MQAVPKSTRAASFERFSGSALPSGAEGFESARRADRTGQGCPVVSADIPGMPINADDFVSQVDGIIGHAPALREVLERLRRVAPIETTVLITGETGTGKELVARAIHRRSRRSARPMVAAHLAAVPEGLIGSELFGHERGAFTGADKSRVGRFELADRGTLFLDEVGELSAELQVALLRALQEGEFERIGASHSHRVDVRLIAATNRNLEEAMAQGRFRPDLFYRLNVFPIHVPALRERREDVPALAQHILSHMGQRMGRQFSGIEQTSLDRLMVCDWPGNIRQLENVIEQSAILCDEPELRIPPEVVADAHPATEPAAMVSHLFAGVPTLEELKKRYISQLLVVTQGNMTRAAALLDIDRRSLYRIVERYHIELPGRKEITPSLEE
jgi:transcriptional regulator with GAF, ATPase, and Fis domain